MISKLEKELLLFEIKEPNKEEFDKFKAEYLYSKQRMHIARLARKFIYDLEDCIVFLKRQIDNVNKLTPKEYKEFLKDIESKRKDYNLLKKENESLIIKIGLLNENNRKLQVELSNTQSKVLKLINKEL